MEELIIKYRTRKGYCRCCGQKLEKPIISEFKTFTFTKDNFLEWSEYWDEMSKDDDFQDVIEEFIYETIQFFSTSSYETIFVEESQIYKAKHFVLSDVVNK